MASQPLLNSLLACRKRSALSQEEVAYLLGAQGGAKVSRYERFLREPGLQAALAYEAIFDRPVSEIFSGLYKTIQKEVSARAKKLKQKEFQGKTGEVSGRKRQFLAKIAAPIPKNSSKQS